MQVMKISNEFPRSRADDVSIKIKDFIFAASSGVLISFITLRCTIGICSAYIFQCTSFL